jgi:uncharacterized repeat protein (TIGR01451 family)
VPEEGTAQASGVRTAGQETQCGERSRREVKGKQELVRAERALREESQMIKGKLTNMNRAIGVATAATLWLALGCPAPASAQAECASCKPWWHVNSGSAPGNLPPGGEGTIVANAENLGDAKLRTPVVVTDTLPAGLTPVRTSLAISGQSDLNDGLFGEFFCTISGREVVCTVPEEFMETPGEPESLARPYGHVEARISVKVAQTAKTGEENKVSVSGGEAARASAARPIVVDRKPTPFGVEQYELQPENEGGLADTQAGSHPFQLTSTLTLNQGTDPATPPALAKDLSFDLPPGLIGNPTPFPQCTGAQFSTLQPANGAIDLCPNNTVIGVAAITIDEPGNLGLVTIPVPLFNLTPSVGEPARFGFEILSTLNILDTAVRTGGDYGVVVTVKNITELPNFVAARVTFWGVPGDPRHDPSRGWSCFQPPPFVSPCTPVREQKPPPLLTLPTSCSGPLRTTVSADSWANPSDVLPLEASNGESLDGCNRLPFGASIGVAPDGRAASTASGLTVGIHVPQEEALNPTGLSPADVRDTTVVLPAGVALNPAAADGLQACSEAQIGLSRNAAPSCPEASKVGTVEIKTPLLPNTLTGAAYLAAQNLNPFGSLVALYIVAQDPVSGVLVKLAGEVIPDPVTGQLVSTFKSTPQLPFEDFTLHFFGGDRAPLSTPPSCGSYTTTTSIAPWSGGEPVTPSSTFEINTGPNGSACPSPLPFSPSLTAGTTSIQAGGFSPFTMTMSRDDGNQNLQAIQLKMPPGLSGLLSSVKLCKEPQADQGLCASESEIGETIVSVGLGGSPFSVRGGKVFITEGYEGAPYGLSIVNPAKAGPYDLEKNTPCDCVVVRAKIEVDPITAALTITSDNSGPYKIPTILGGIPLQIKHVNVLINRPGFTFNPTNCNPMRITGSLSSTEGATSALSVPLQVTNCATLAFKPGFKVSTAGKTSRANGASLSVKLTYPKAPFGSQANISKVKVDLPKQLPSRLTTLQKACPDSTFVQNPALCSPQSRVGQAKATTPLLPVPLTGPAYFVSHGGAKFPELVIVLSGYGTTIDLHAETFISPAGITSSTFRTVPDAPVGTFELTLPQGQFSALAANGNLCNSTLKMPTAFTAQNGAVIKQNTPIGVTGCPKHKRKAKKAAHGLKKAKKRN